MDFSKELGKELKFLDDTDRPFRQKITEGDQFQITGNTSSKSEHIREDHHAHITSFKTEKNNQQCIEKEKIVDDKAKLFEDQGIKLKGKTEEKKLDDEVLTTITMDNVVEHDIENIDVVDGKSTLGIIRSERKDYMGIKTVHTTYPYRILPLQQQQEKEKSLFKKIQEFFIPSAERIDEMTPVVPSDSYYDMACYPRGVFTIINMHEFWDSENNPSRHGTNTDADALTELFLDLGFIVERFDNPSSKEIDLIVKKTANDDYSNKSCCICAILSHGDNGKFSSKDGEIDIEKMLKKFQTPQLAGKPKFFIFQACRGEIYMDGLDTTDGRVKKSPTESKLTVPAESDFLYAYSTVPGYYSWRNDLKGAWFIQDLVEVFRKEAHQMDVLRMLIRVNEKVALRLPKTAYVELNKKKQVPSFVCQLRKDLFLIPPSGPLISK